MNFNRRQPLLAWSEIGEIETSVHAQDAKASSKAKPKAKSKSKAQAKGKAKGAETDGGQEEPKAQPKKLPKQVFLTNMVRCANQLGNSSSWDIIKKQLKSLFRSASVWIWNSRVAVAWHCAFDQLRLLVRYIVTVAHSSIFQSSESESQSFFAALASSSSVF